MNAREVGHAIRKFQNSISARGIGGTVMLAGQRVMRRKSLVGSRVKEHPFDLHYGVHTHGPIDLWKDVDETSQYDAVAPSLFREACARWQASIPPNSGGLESYTFIDLGAGLGRALLLASQFPFREVVGVELGDSLVKVALQNIGKWTACGHARCPINIVCQDALTYEFPAGPLVVFLDNPFGERITSQVLDHLLQRQVHDSSPIDIIYVYPKHASLLADDTKFELLSKDRILYDQTDKDADTFFRDGELCNWYRLVPRKESSAAENSFSHDKDAALG